MLGARLGMTKKNTKNNCENISKAGFVNLFSRKFCLLDCLGLKAVNK